MRISFIFAITFLLVPFFADAQESPEPPADIPAYLFVVILDDGTKITKHIYAGDELIATVEVNGTSAPVVYYDHTDHLGGSSVLTNSTGAKEQLLDYYPFGGIRLNEKTSAFDEQRKFTGQEYDTSTNLHYYVQRYYNQDVGRFTSQDPVFLAVGTNDKRVNVALSNPQLLNSYSYTANNPLKYVDEEGEFAIGIGLNLGGGVTGLYGQGSVYGVVTVSSEHGIELGFLRSAEGGGMTVVGAGHLSGAVMFSSNAQSVSDLEGVSVVGGGSVRALAGAGFDVDTSRPDSNNNRITNMSISAGVGANFTPYVLPGEVHGGLSYTDALGNINVNQSVTNVSNVVQSSFQSTYSSIQNQLKQIQTQVDTLKSNINQELKKKKKEGANNSGN
ncbi:MAG: RHS repeat-associated core domain-containing protein [Patescibacteria group bacterium]